MKYLGTCTLAHLSTGHKVPMKYSKTLVLYLNASHFYQYFNVIIQSFSAEIFILIANSFSCSNSQNMVTKTCGKVHHTFSDTTNTSVTENQGNNYSPNSYSKSKIW